MSPGCGQPPGPTGERSMRVGARTGRYIVSVPRGYEPSSAYPLVFAFHGRNRNHRDCQKTDCAGIQSVMGNEAVLVYLQSLREPLNAEKSGWEHADELDDNVRFFDQVFADVKRRFCVNERRVLLTGTSSGGTFANWLGCRYGEQVLAVAPVSGGWSPNDACKGAPASILIHGIDDPHVPLAYGETARKNFVARAQCGADSAPPLGEMHAAIRAKRDAKPTVEDAACVDFQGCSAKVRWCEHSYGGYDGSTHGWPPIGGKLIWDFFRTL